MVCLCPSVSVGQAEQLLTAVRDERASNADAIYDEPSPPSFRIPCRTSDELGTRPCCRASVGACTSCPVYHYMLLLRVVHFIYV